jgi:hypothetical protein
MAGRRAEARLRHAQLGFAQIDAPRHTRRHGKRPGHGQRALRQKQGVERRVDEPHGVEPDVDGSGHTGTGHIHRPRNAEPPAGRDRAVAIEADPAAADRGVERKLVQDQAQRGRDDARAGGGEAPGHGVEARLAPDAQIEVQLAVDGLRGNEPVGQRKWQGAAHIHVDPPAFEADKPVGLRAEPART